MKHYCPLQKILSHQLQPSPAHSIVKKALESMHSLAADINERKRQDECMERLKELTKSCGDDGQGVRIDISSYGELLLEVNEIISKLFIIISFIMLNI